MEKKRKKPAELFSGPVARALGFGRNRALGELVKALNGDPNALVTADDFRCDAEGVEVDKNGNVTKSPALNKP